MADITKNDSTPTAEPTPILNALLNNPGDNSQNPADGVPLEPSQALAVLTSDATIAPFSVDEVKTIKGLGTDGLPNDRKIIEIAAAKAGVDINDKNSKYYLEPGQEYSISGKAFQKFLDIADDPRPKHFAKNFPKAFDELFDSKRELIKPEQLAGIKSIEEEAKGLRSKNAAVVRTTFLKVKEDLAAQGLEFKEIDAIFTKQKDSGVDFVKRGAYDRLQHALEQVEKHQVLTDNEKASIKLAFQDTFQPGFNPRGLPEPKSTAKISKAD